MPCTCLINSPENLQSLETFTESAFHNIRSKTSINQNLSTTKNDQIGVSTNFTNPRRKGILVGHSFWPDEMSLLRKELKSNQKLINKLLDIVDLNNSKISFFLKVLNKKFLRPTKNQSILTLH